MNLVMCCLGLVMQQSWPHHDESWSRVPLHARRPHATGDWRAAPMPPLDLLMVHA